MNKEQEIAEYLKEKYKPQAVILHGSRAVGKERAHSDWDIVLLFKAESSKKNKREYIAGEDVEWKGYVVPMASEKIYDTIGIVLQYTKVLWEENNEGTKLINQAKDEYAKSPKIKAENIDAWKQFLNHKLNGMIDDTDTNDQVLFFKHSYEFFMRAVNLWFEILHDENQKPFYLALPIIKEKDPEYHDQLMVLSGKGQNQEKIDTGKKVIEKLFN